MKNILKTVLGYATTVGSLLVQGYMISHGYSLPEAIAAGSIVATTGSRMLQQTTPSGKEVFPK